MEITTLQVQARVPVTVVRMNGNFDSNSIDTFNQEINLILAAGTKDLLLDMSGVAFMSSVGIRALSNLYDRLHRTDSAEEKKAILQATRAGTYRAPHLKLCGVQKNVHDIIKLVNLDWYIEILPNEKAALAAF